MLKSAKAALILAMLLALTPGISPTWARERIHYLKEVERKVFQLTNEVRQNHHLMPLSRDTALIDIARAHNDDMLNRNFFSHVSPDGKSVQERVAPAYARTLSRAGENIWSGHGYDYSDSNLMARVIVDSWMSSPGHRANILNPEYNYVGVGVSAMGKEIRATQNFIQRR
ncbi:MAG: CAP domain-containing protein [Thermodesulfobacteriota bacterium]